MIDNWTPPLIPGTHTHTHTHPDVHVNYKNGESFNSQEPQQCIHNNNSVSRLGHIGHIGHIGYTTYLGL